MLCIFYCTHCTINTSTMKARFCLLHTSYSVLFIRAKSFYSFKQWVIQMYLSLKHLMYKRLFKKNYALQFQSQSINELLQRVSNHTAHLLVSNVALITSLAGISNDVCMVQKTGQGLLQTEPFVPMCGFTQNITTAGLQA